jgi:spore coat protein U-like protein
MFRFVRLAAAKNHPSWPMLARSLAAAGSLLLGQLLAGPAGAATTTAALTVQITITAACSVNPATLDFGSNAGTALLAADVDASTTVLVTCTSGIPYSIGMGNGQNATGSQRRMINGGNYISYDLYTDAGLLNAWTTASNSATCTSANSCVLGTGNGSAQSIDVYGVVPSVAVVPAAGSYADSVTMTVTY